MTQPGSELTPESSAADLARLAEARPELWPEILRHPNAYPGLTEWIAEQQTLLQPPLPPAPVGPTAAPPTVPSASPSWQPPGSTVPQEYPPLPAPPMPPAPVAPAAFGASESQPGLTPGSGLSAAPAQAPRRRGRIVLASVLAAVLVLGGTTAGLAVTKTWPFSENGPFSALVGGSSGSAEAVANEEPEATFADGIQEKWEIPGTAFGSEAQLFGHVPRMMGPINQASRPDQPIQLRSGVLVHYSLDGEGYDGPLDWALLDPENGDVRWTQEALGYPLDCATNEAQTEAACLVSSAGDTQLVRFDADGVAAQFEAEPGSVHFSQGGLLLQHESGATVYDLDGKVRDEVSVDGDAAAMTNNAEMPECVWLYAAGRAVHAGSNCGAERSVYESDAFNWALIDEQDPKWLFSGGDDGTVVLDAKTGDELWRSDALPAGWYMEPELVPTENGPGILLSRPDGNTLTYVIANMQTGEEQPVRAGGNDRLLIVAGDELLLFAGDPPVGDPVTRVHVYDPNTGEQIAEHEFPGIETVSEITGGPRGVLLAHPMCTDCSTADGSNVLDRYTFMGAGDDTEGRAVQPAADIEIPNSIPVSCPGDTILLAWAEFEDGWIVVCGISADRPSYVAYQPSNGAKRSYSLGATDPTGGKATGAVTWDADLGRYLANLANGSTLSFDHKLGVVTVREPGSSGTEKVVDQQKGIRYIFVWLDDRIRTAEDAANETGAFDVQAPEDTAEDQIRYMIEVLDKAYQGRALVKDALPKLENCTASAGGYGDTVKAMQAVRDNRAELLEALDSMPVDKIPEGQKLLDDLTEAIYYSHEANIEYVAWAEAANSSGCASLSSTGQSMAAASDGPKESFASRWNRAVAPKYGVKTFDAWYI